ncbi:MAG: hypothetical protein ABL936_13495 [Aestuariivirga sp.]
MIKFLSNSGLRTSPTSCVSEPDMLTASTSILPRDSFDYSPNDLESMRQAFRRACDEIPLMTETAEQRYVLAQAIVNRFQRGLNEMELIAEALRKAH